MCAQAQMTNMTAAATGKAIYLLTNDAENAVVALPIEKDGQLCRGTITKTEGAGSNFIDGKTMMKAMPDALASQSALTLAGEVSSRWQLVSIKHDQS